MPVNTSSLMEPRIKGHAMEIQPTNQMVSVISQLRNDLQQSRAETQQITDQMNVLVSLIKRSWKGDKTANIHLANIVGVHPSDMIDVKRQSQKAKTPSVKNWERLSLKLLEKEYDLVKKEIEQRQQAYIEGRTLYMEEVMASHHQDMRGFSLQKRSNSKDTVHQVDKKFLNNFRRGMISRPPSGVGRVRCKSAGMIRPQMSPENHGDSVLKQMVIEPTETKSWLIDGSTNKVPSPQVMNKYKDSYDNPQRYLQSHLFEMGDVIEPEALAKRTRPYSAAFQKKQDHFRARPKSASHICESTFVTQKHNRPLKNETTYPVPVKQKEKDQPKQEGEDLRNASLTQEADARETDNTNHTPVEGDVQKRPYKSRSNSETIHKFEDDLKKMYSMEDEFRKTTLSLQKKLGIAPNGMIL